MKDLKRLIIVFLFPLTVVGGPSIVFGKSQQKTVQKIAIIPILDSQVLPKYIQKAEKAFEENFKKQASLSIVPLDEIEEGIEEVLKKKLSDEVNVASNFFYHFRYKDAEKLMEGREDLESLKLKMLIAYSKGNKESAEDFSEQIIAIDPGVKLSVKDFPPGLVSLFEKTRKQKSPKKLFESAKLGKEIPISKKFPDGWSERLEKVMNEMSWDYLFLFRIEPIGWNHKMTGFLFQSPQVGIMPKTRAVDLVDLSDLQKASQILVKTLFIIDTSSDFH